MLIAALLLSVVGPAQGGIPKSDDTEHGSLSRDALHRLIEAHRGKVAVVIEVLPTRERFEHNPDEPMPTASLIKFPIMIEAYRQSAVNGLDLEQQVVLSDDDKVPGSGILTKHFSAGARFSLRDAIRLMIAYSDNTATNMVLDRIGLGSTAKTMEAMGFPNTKAHSKVYRRDTSVFPDRSQVFGLGSTTAADMVELLRRLHRREIVDEASSQVMLDHLAACEDRSMFRRDLPAEVKVAHKTGAVSDVRTSAGIIETPAGPVALCVLTSGNEDRRWTAENEAEILIAAIARQVYEDCREVSVVGGKPAKEAPLRMGEVGSAVERLQTLLNDRLDPSPRLIIDGQFGPLTESAVRRFQESAGLDVTGVVDSSTWERLNRSSDDASRVR